MCGSRSTCWEVDSKSRGSHYCNTAARLKPEVKIEEAQAEMNVIASGLEAQYPDDRR